jgi:hypothetical protein
LPIQICRIGGNDREFLPSPLTLRTVHGGHQSAISFTSSNEFPALVSDKPLHIPTPGANN